jgi:hypothetical protein
MKSEIKLQQIEARKPNVTLNARSKITQPFYHPSVMLLFMYIPKTGIHDRQNVCQIISALIPNR